MLNHTSSLRDDGGYYWDAKSKTHLKDVFTPGGKHFGTGAMWDKKFAPGTYFNTPTCRGRDRHGDGARDQRTFRSSPAPPDSRSDGVARRVSSGRSSPKDLANVATLFIASAPKSTTKEIWDSNGPWIAQVDDYSKTPPAQRALPGLRDRFQWHLVWPRRGIAVCPRRPRASDEKC